MPSSRPASEIQKLDLSQQEWELYLRRVMEPAVPVLHELRAVARHRKIVQCVLRVNAGRGAQVYVIHSRDIGEGGMGFMHSEPLPVAAPCTVVLETNAGTGHVLPGRVRWSREVGGGLYAIGVGFDHALDLHDFVDVAEHGGHHAVTGEAHAA